MHKNIFLERSGLKVTEYVVTEKLKLIKFF